MLRSPTCQESFFYWLRFVRVRVEGRAREGGGRVRIRRGVGLIFPYRFPYSASNVSIFKAWLAPVPDLILSVTPNRPSSTTE